jgi:hypothetical protein
MMSDRKLFEELKAIRDEMLGSFWNPVMREHIDRVQAGENSMDDTKKVTVSWTEFHNYAAEFEVPDDLTDNEDIVDWVMVWESDALKSSRKPYEINTDWDSFTVE